ncbi:hypothetical protein [Nocardiopsis sp. NRRL B-16309]|uniref:hypothetical protein n=1 Tax=Nocardiopsis sp. NRRL B-16309 TaxID=1519494 RepID=UPI0006AE98A8|nr:hypothetical protein [Nocardiopsis sp. NRRL B-16309]KOX07853.1 hypothetical protein ADL05_28020 [Nocardiopsis sp. NRRL B-16309]
MYFHPPTFEAGPVATAIGLGVIAYLLVLPLVLRRLKSPSTRPGTPASRVYRFTCWASLGEVLAAMAFVGTATVVSVADVGLAAPTVYWFGDNPAATMVALLAYWGWPLLIVGVAVQIRAGARQRAKIARGEAEPPRLPPGTAALLPRNAGERAWMVTASSVGALGTFAVVHAVLVPLLLVRFGLHPGDVVLGVALLSGWALSHGGWRSALTMALFTALTTGAYLFVIAGSLLFPLLFWGLFTAVNILGIMHLSRDRPPSVPTKPETDGSAKEV